VSTEKKQRITTPIGVAKWAHVHVPKPPFKDAHGNSRQGAAAKYQIDVVFDGQEPAWKELAKSIMDMVRATPTTINKATQKPMDKQIPIKHELDENDQPTGKFYMTFKTGERFKPGVFDKYGRQIPETVLIGNGSKVKVNFSPQPYNEFGGGVALYLNAVQVVELVEYKPADAKAYGFDVEEPPADLPPIPSGTPAGGESAEPEEDNIPF
jgi:hypothetical protein